jgi:predicted ATPase
MVGRETELAELAALLSSPEVRLVTLTGPGGSGKTRLAIALAQELVERFPDGVFFVPLAAVTSGDVMWSSIAEVLDVPPEARTPPQLFTHVAHRSALLVLDNLEQLAAADDVVTQLLGHAPQVVVLSTSRRALSVPGEHVHSVPPLELPDTDSLALAGSSGAVQLFVQHAQMVRPNFALSESNAGDVAAICRRLDGLPLAIELAAARTRLLSPTALLARLDTALDIAATGKQGPSRQKTLRDTIAWSYDLLTPTQQAFFRRLGVFAGGADLNAIEAVTADGLDDHDRLDLVADLVDASLATITEETDGEPRVGMLATIRAYALDRLHHMGELDQVALAHAEHYLRVVQELHTTTIAGRVDRMLAARGRFEAEHDNVRAALDWAFNVGDVPPPEPGRVQLSLRLCADVAVLWLWLRSGYLTEARRRLERAVSVAGDQDNPELGRCLRAIFWVALSQGDVDRAGIAATQAVAMFRRLGDKRGLADALSQLGRARFESGELVTARAVLDEAASLAQEVDDQRLLGQVLVSMAFLEARVGNPERALELNTIGLGIFQQHGMESQVLRQRQNIACYLREMGRVHEALQQMREVIPDALRLGDPASLVTLAEDFAAALADFGHYQAAARLVGASDALRERDGAPRLPAQQIEIAEPLTRARTALGLENWQQEYQQGRQTTVEDALSQAHAEPIS